MPASTNTETIKDKAIRVPRLMDQTIHEYGMKVNERAKPRCSSRTPSLGR